MARSAECRRALDELLAPRAPLLDLAPGMWVRSNRWKHTPSQMPIIEVRPTDPSVRVVTRAGSSTQRRQHARSYTRLPQPQGERMLSASRLTSSRMVATETPNDFGATIPISRHPSRLRFVRGAPARRGLRPRVRPLAPVIPLTLPWRALSSLRRKRTSSHAEHSFLLPTSS